MPGSGVSVLLVQSYIVFATPLELSIYNLLRLFQVADPGYAAYATKQIKCIETQYASIYYDEASETYKDSLKKDGMYCKHGAYCNKINNGRSKPVCQRCPHGRYAHARGQTHCTDCSPGTYLNYAISGAKTCQKCASGEVSKVAASKCEACAVGKYQNVDGLTCDSCPGGRYQNAAGSHHKSGRIVSKKIVFVARILNVLYYYFVLGKTKTSI